MKSEVTLSVLGLLVIAAGCRVGEGLNDQLMRASQNGKVVDARALLERGADPNYVFEGNYTPIFLASSDGHSEVVKLLLEHGADPSLKSYEGTNAYDVAQDERVRDILREHKNKSRLQQR